MSVLYVKEQGALIQKRSERLLITRNNQTLLEIPIYNIDSVAVIGNVQITTQALQALMKNGVDVRYFAWSGRYLGTTSAASSKNIFLRLAQYQLYDDMERRMDLARRIVANKIGNQMEMIRRHRWAAGEEEHHLARQELEKAAARTAEVSDSNALMGVEGHASAVYFRIYGLMFRDDDAGEDSAGTAGREGNCARESNDQKETGRNIASATQPWYAFHGRSRRPPRDPVNAIISLGYTFLTNEVTTALESESFEMYMGFLHGIRYGRKSLPLDIVEEFRQPVVDRMTLRLFNRHMLQEDDFLNEDGAVSLTEEGFRKFCRTFERWMSDPVYTGESVCYRSLIRKQADQLKHVVQHGKEYEPYHFGGEQNSESESADASPEVSTLPEQSSDSADSEAK